MEFIKKRNFCIIAFTGLLVAVISPFLYYSWQKYIVNYFETVADIIRTVANFSIAGYFVPWRYVLSSLVFIAVGFYFKARWWQKESKGNEQKDKTGKEDANGPTLISGKTLLEIHTASQSIREISKRLDRTEKTTHLIMRQMEAMTKCLAQVLKDDRTKNVNNNNNGNKNSNFEEKDKSLETHL